MKFLWVLLLGIIIISCARVNMDSRDYYEHTRKIRHGVVPVESPGLSSKEIKAKPLDTESVARGEALYQGHCMSCHGQQGYGDGEDASGLSVRPPNLQESIRNIPDFHFYMTLSQWKGEMPGWEHPFSDRERSDIAEYLKSLVR